MNKQPSQLTPSGLPALPAQERVLDAISQCHGLVGLLVEFSLSACHRSGADMEHLYAALEVLHARMADVVEMADPHSALWKQTKGADHAHN